MDADTLLVLGAGRLLEQGPPVELMKMTGTPIGDNGDDELPAGGGICRNGGSGGGGEADSSGGEAWAGDKARAAGRSGGGGATMGVFAQMVAAARSAHRSG